MSDQRVIGTCKSIRRRLRRIGNLGDSALMVEVATKQQINDNELLNTNPAACDPKNYVVLINDERFFSLGKKERKGVLAHEIGHFIYDKLKSPPIEANGNSRTLENAAADYWACHLGLKRAIKKSRKPRYVKEYCDILDQYKNECEFCRNMQKLYNQNGATFCKKS